MVNETNSKINEVYKKVLQKLEEEKKNSKKNYDKLKNYIRKMESDYSNQKNVGQNEIKGELSDSDLRCLAELTKRITDLEKQMKMLYHGLDISKFKEEVAKLENELMQKIDEKDFYELSNKVNLNSAIMNNIKESLERANDIGNKNSKDLNFFVRKLESVNATVIAFKAALEALSGIKNENIFDPSRYLDIATFNEFIKAYQKDVEKIEKNIEDVRRLITELANALTTKASGEDMRTFEGLINNKLEEIKILCSRKFADKIEMNKNFMYEKIFR
jgi:polyhydroxyalkanoate synthesis regulator phasin